MTLRSFNYRAFVTRWRELAGDYGIDARTGELLPVAGRPWWVQPDYWTDPGPAHSVVEAAAITSIAAQVRAVFHVADPAVLVTGRLETLTDRLMDAVTAVVNADRSDQYAEEVRDDPAALHDLSLRERHWHEYIGYYDPADLPLPLLHQMRGVEVIDIEGLRLEVPAKTPRGWGKWEAYKQTLRHKAA